MISNEQIAHDLALIITKSEYEKKVSKPAFLIAESMRSSFIKDTYLKFYNEIFKELKTRRHE